MKTAAPYASQANEKPVETVETVQPFPLVAGALPAF
jgi:hypothetical protein